MTTRWSYLSLVLFSHLVFSQAVWSLESNCWDGTFNYQVATLALSGDFVEIGLKASFNFAWEKTGEQILDETGTPITASSGFGETYIFLAFAPSDCTKNGDAWHCEKKGLDNVDFDKVLFTGKWPTREADFQIATASVDKVEMTMDSRRMSVKITKVDGDVTSTASTAMGFRYCSLSGRHGNTFFGDARFPNSLRDRLRNP